MAQTQDQGQAHEPTAEQRYELARAAFDGLARRSYQDPREATAALRKLADFFPVCAPGGTLDVAEIAPGHKISITAYTPQSCDDKGNGGDVFIERSSQSICFRAAFLKRLAGGVGLEWIPSETRVSFPAPIGQHATGHPHCVTVTVAGRYRDYTGQWRTVSASKTLDLRDEALGDTAKTAKQIKREREDITSRAETMAKSRCIADACISRTIDRQDVGAPIICAQLYRADLADPQDGERAVGAMYGHAPSAPLDDLPASSTPADVIDQRTGEVTQGSPTSGPPPAAGGTTPSASPASPPASAKPFVIHQPGEPGHNKPFADASKDELVSYAMFLGGRLASGGIPAPGVQTATAKLRACEAEIARRESLEQAPW